MAFQMSEQQALSRYTSSRHRTKSIPSFLAACPPASIPPTAATSSICSARPWLDSPCSAAFRKSPPECPAAPPGFCHTLYTGTGKPQFVYAWKLVATDKTPTGRRDDISLREKEKEINRDIADGIDTVGKKMTVCQLCAKQNSQRTDVKQGTKKKREYLMGLLQADPLGGKSIDTVKPSDAKEWAIHMRGKGSSFRSMYMKIPLMPCGADTSFYSNSPLQQNRFIQKNARQDCPAGRSFGVIRASRGPWRPYRRGHADSRAWRGAQRRDA